MLKFLYVVQDIVGNNNNIIANCIFYLTNKSNQLEPKHVVELNSVRNTP